jgi:phospholipase C
MLVVSPWSKGGWVCSQTFDHTSIVRFIEKRFGVIEPNITAWRRAVCGDLTSAFDFTRRDASVPALPPTDAYEPPDNERHPDYSPEPPADPELPRQERGVRPSRALPYNLAVDAHVDGQIRLRFVNLGSAAASFLVTSSTDTEPGPWTYTVGAGRSLSNAWNGHRYNLSVHGPNGFFRQFAGDAGKRGVEVTASHDVTTGAVRLDIANHSRSAVRVTIHDAYARKDHTIRVRPSERSVHTTHPQQRTGTWYDLSVTVGGDAAYLRRYAGRVETGRPGITDPAIATV